MPLYNIDSFCVKAIIKVDILSTPQSTSLSTEVPRLNNLYDKQWTYSSVLQTKTRRKCKCLKSSWVGSRCEKPQLVFEERCKARTIKLYTEDTLDIWYHYKKWDLTSPNCSSKHLANFWCYIVRSFDWKCQPGQKVEWKW